MVPIENKVDKLAEFFSEEPLIKYRVHCRNWNILLALWRNPLPSAWRAFTNPENLEA